MTDQKFPPRIRGYWEGDPYMFCPEQWEQVPFTSKPTTMEYEFISIKEHEAILREERINVWKEAEAICMDSFLGPALSYEYKACLEDIFLEKAKAEREGK